MAGKGKGLWEMIVDWGPWRRFKTQVVQDLKGGGRGPIAGAIRTDWPKIYFDFLRREYRKNSSGGGEWPPLAERTLKKKLRRRGIMRVTDTLYNALIPGNPGNIITNLPNGVRCGLGGDRVHPGSKAKLTIGRLANIHNQGVGSIPQRRIVVPPTQEVLAKLKRSAERRFREFSASMPKPKGSGM